MSHIGLNWIWKVLIAAVANSLIWSLSFAQDNGKIHYAEIGALSLDSGSNWVQRIFNNAISNDVQIVGLGEVSHGGYEPLALEAKMTQYLVEKRGYKNILLEFADIQNIRPVRQYLLNNNIKDLSVADSLAKETAVGMLNTQEILSQLFRWLKQYNLSHPGEMVRIAGFDFSLDAGFRNFFLYNYIIPFDYINAQRLLYHWENIQVLDTSRIATIKTWFNVNKSRLAKEMRKDEFDELVYHLQNETHSILYEALKADTSEENSSGAGKYRDSLMAGNVTRLAGSQKTIIWAHNGHISTTDGYMGKYLKELYKSRYFILLTDFSNEANVNVVSEEKAAPGSRIIHEQRFAAENTTIAYHLLKNYGIPSGIFLNRDLPVNNLYNTLNLIDIYGKQFRMLSDKAFDVLVIFNNITSHSKAANNK